MINCIIEKLKTAQRSGYMQLDITLMYSLLRNLCPNLTPPTKGWGIQELPDPMETTIGDDIERIRIIRKEIRHKYSAGMSESDFTKWWNEIHNICDRQQKQFGKQFVVNLRSIECMTFEDSQLRSLEKFRHEDKREEGLYVKTLKVSPKSNEEDTKVNSLSECCAKTLKEMVNHVNERTSRQDISMLYEAFKCFLDSGKQTQENHSALKILNGIKRKIHWYVDLNPSEALKILAEFATFTTYLAREYEVQQAYQSSSILMTLEFYEESTLKKFHLDFASGKIQDLLKTLLCSESLLSIFEISPRNFRICVEDLDMDSSSAQDVIRCDLCETALVKMHCDFCDVNLCKPCIGEHISDDYDKHKIVQFQQRKSTLIYSKCATHETKRCKFQCDECNKSVCSLCTISEAHRGHTIEPLLDIFNSKRKAIREDAEELEKIISPTYEEIAHEIEAQIDNLDVEYDTLSAAVTKHGKEWHKEVDNIVNRMKTEIKEIKNKHMSILKKHLNEIKQIQNLLEKTLLELISREESGEVTMTTEYSSKIKELRKIPPRIKVSLPTFRPKSKDTECIYKLFGSLTPLSTETEEHGYILKKLETPKRELLKEPELIITIDTGYGYLRNVTCLSEKEIWTSGEVSDMKCFNVQGSLIKTIITKSGEWPRDIAVTGDGDLLYTDLETQTVNKVKNEQTDEMIRLKGWRPRNLCVTSSGDLLVTVFSDDKTQSKVVRYSGSTEKQTIQFDDEGKPLYSGNIKLKYLSENRNLDICVADSEAGAVVVVNQAGKLRFRYTGNSFTTKKKPFKPFGITTDSQSQILTTVCDFNCIHILDQDGQFLRYIDKCDLNGPYGLCVDKSDNPFVAEWKGKIKKIEYLESG